jgi:acetyltransferase-like isoleucine patch superfamily enzyme
MVVVPASLRRLIATRILGWDVHPSAYIGRSLIVVRHVTMGPDSGIGPFNVIRHLDELILERGASIATRNRIEAHPLAAVVFAHMKNRRATLALGPFAKITDAHEIDCSDAVTLGKHATIAGFRTQVLTHSLDLVRDRQTTGPVELGDRCAVMSGCILLSGTRVPARSIVSAGSVVTTKLTKELTFYRGNPAVEIRTLPETLKYFHREDLSDTERYYRAVEAAEARRDG